MSRRVLLVDADVDALGALAASLRSRGLDVAIASEAFDAVEQAFQVRPDVVVASGSLDAEADLEAALRAVPELAATPVLRLVDPSGVLSGDRDLPRDDLDRLVSSILELSPREVAVLPQETRGDLAQMPLVDLLQLLAMNRRSGVLAVTTGSGAGEVRVVEGEVIDAVYRRLEGEKALYRLLGERDGNFAFSPGEPRTPRRIEMPTSMLLMEAMRQVDELRMRRQALAPAGEAFFLEALGGAYESLRETHEPPAGGGPEVELGFLLLTPRTLDELLDEMDTPDLVVLETLSVLVQSGRVRRIALAAHSTPIAPPEQLPVLQALVGRITRPGFARPARLAIAASEARMPALAQSVRRIADALVPNEPPPRFGLPRLLGTLRLGDGVELAIVGVPADTRLAPLWSLQLGGAGAVVRVEEAGGEVLAAHCAASEVPLVEAEALMGAFDCASPQQLVALIRAALEAAAGV